jgi:hypothetical protein
VLVREEIAVRRDDNARACAARVTTAGPMRSTALTTVRE